MTAALVAASATGLEQKCLILDEERVKVAASKDPVYQLLVAKVAANDWRPQKAQELAYLRQFYAVRDRLSMVEDLIVYTYEQVCPRLLIPEELRLQVITGLHAGHKGVDSMLRRQRQSVYWPGMEGDLQSHRDGCASCDIHAPSQPAEPLVLTAPPEYPFQSTVVDMLQLEGHMYMAHRVAGSRTLSTWYNVIKNHISVEDVLHKMGSTRANLDRWGTNLISKETTSFFRKWGVTVRLSSAHYPQSNGRAKAAVKTAKRIIRANIGKGGSLDCNKASLAILQYHQHPTSLKGFGQVTRPSLPSVGSSEM
ncbi:uncharacterized protein K02A2.6-like [Macrobrachium nipponense]|uniref:uncharacterized protein K02A2.6-like n=1 Tax=Macrobrachium nipponense TaxID=159736 RepID=UPI0030C7DE4C